ncbi:uncharacterized mitochondrial protein AtMg00810-like [Arachis stenosperma]|uniref:uncharacterized mitochondrial protein AtMg00810-like n=1 Tax=Arachis stenosperma TaxID=217475 RepID=UPI0025ABA92D|nr:uncharacterized mitochondrial protein AtMg00810-like [Arachis stenosperma]
MRQPRGYELGDGCLVCKLTKALYSLKQASRTWYHKYSIALLHLGFSATKSDVSIFVRFKHNFTPFVLVYVDDIIITGDSEGAISQVIQQLNDKFALKDLGDLHYFLEIQVTKTNAGGLVLSQEKYIKDLVKKVEIEDCEPCHTPLPSSVTFSAFGGSVFNNPRLYISVVRNLAYSISLGTLSFGLHLQQTSVQRIAAYSDSDYGVDPDDRKSIVGFCVFLERNLVSWSSKKQGSVARSSTEAEYRVMADLVAELIWIKNLMVEFRIPLSTPHQYIVIISVQYC